MNDRRLNSRSIGFFVGALGFAHEASFEKDYRDHLDGRFVASGAARHITQRIAGFPVFDILVLPVRRAGTTPIQVGTPPRQGGALP
jgi:hypothetical protein